MRGPYFIRKNPGAIDPVAGSYRPFGGLLGILVVFGFSLLPLIGGVGAAAADTSSPVERVVPFVAYRLGNIAPAYKGEYHSTRQGAFITDRHIYRTLAGVVVMEIESRFDQVSGQSLTYSSLDYRTGRMEKVWRDQNALHYQLRRTHTGPLEEGVQEWVSAEFLWTDMLHIVSRLWLQLERGEVYPFKLFVPSRKTEYSLLLKKSRDSDSGRIRMEMSPDSAFLRLIVNPVTLVYAPGHPGQLLEYQGRSALRDESGHLEDLRIVMHPL